MAEILLCTLNARYIHASFGLRYLLANLEEMTEKTTLLEFEISQDPKDVAEEILRHSPRIVGLGVYIWNTAKTYEVISVLRRVKPEIIIVIGGPEVSYEIEGQPITALVDFVVSGEGEIVFRELCRSLLSGVRPDGKIIHAKLPDLDQVALPYELYSEDDLANRVVYVEVSRGCPFTCEFCLSSLDLPVRQFDLERVLAALDSLYVKGLRTFKFVDRTFNLNLRTATKILQFFLDRMEPGLFVHFEMVPDRFPKQLREVVAQFPPGSLQFEVGIQSFNPQVGELISRRQDFVKIGENLSFLRRETGVYVHADLIAGLPGEDIESFGRGFDTLVALDPHEIQVGILKRLRGTPIVRHDLEWGMRYSEEPPYEVLQTKLMDFSTLQKMRRFAKFWDLVANSGNFRNTRVEIWREAESPFHSFMELSEWLYSRLQRRSGVSLKSLTALLYEFLVSEKGRSAEEIGPLMAREYCQGGRTDLPLPLRPYVSEVEAVRVAHPVKLKRQQRTANG